MRCPDSSVLVAGFVPAHPFFSVAQAALARVRREGSLVAHTIAEAMAVLTAGPFLAAPDRIHQYLQPLLARQPVGIEPADYPAAIEELTRADVSGGALYDGLIAIGAREAGATLLSLDARAAGTYERSGVSFELLVPRR
ncbi:MAG: PIN domain-containing protein [Solirubrobacterales bacterium]